jgi:hypothetical protein
MKLEELLNEDLPLIKFKYENSKHNKVPRVKVLDFHYKGAEGQKSFGKSDDLLGFNTNYFKDKKKGKDAIDDIDSFARLLKADNKEKYQRIKDFYPDAIPYIRRYKKEHIKKLRLKKGFLWHPANWEDCEEYGREIF